MVSFEDVRRGNGLKRSMFHQYELEENCDEDLDDYFHQPGKKRRLTADQVQFLEKSFDLENKLEPERKILLAKDLGLQPRQVAIWFQNRRARWKTKQLEKDYDVLQANYTSLKADCDSLSKVNDKLKAEVVSILDYAPCVHLYLFAYENLVFDLFFRFLSSLTGCVSEIKKEQTQNSRIPINYPKNHRRCRFLNQSPKVKYPNSQLWHVRKI